MSLRHSPYSCWSRSSSIFAVLLAIAVVVVGGLPVYAIQNNSRQTHFIERDTPPSVIYARGKWSPGENDERFNLNSGWTVFDSHGNNLGALTLPFCWTGEEHQLIIQRRFTIPRELWNRQWTMVIEGFAQNMSINLNGVQLSAMSGYGIPCYITVPGGGLRFGSVPNELTITIDNKINRYDSVPLKGSSGSRYRYGGIFGEIYLNSRPEIAVTDLRTYWHDGNVIGKDSIIVKTQLRINEDFTSQESHVYQSFLYDSSGKEVAKSHDVAIEFPANGVLELESYIIAPELKRWELRSDGDPKLYSVKGLIITGKTKSVVHGLETRLSAGRKALKTSGWTINGLPRELKCVSVIFSTTESGDVVIQKDIDRYVQSLMELGANAVRVCQGPAPLYFLDQCDQNGILVFEEIPVFQAPDRILVDEDFLRQSQEQLRIMIERDRQFTCIAAWGLGAGINHPNAENILYFNELTRTAKSLDDRPVFISTPYKSGITATPLDFIIVEWRDLTQVLPGDLQCDKPVFLSDIRQIVQPGRQGGWADPTTETGQAHYLVSYLQNAANVQWYAGIIIGDLFDWHVAAPTTRVSYYNKDGIATTGLVDFQGKSRLAFNYLQEYWATGEAQPLNKMQAVTYEGGIFVVTGLILLLILLISMRRNHLFRTSLARTFSSPSGIFQDISDNRFFQSSSSLLVAIFASGTVAMLIMSWLITIRESYALDWLLGYFLGGNVLHFLSASLIWQPARGLVVLWGLLFFCIGIAAAGFAMISKILGKKCSLTQAVDFVSWSIAVFLIIVPLGIVAFRLYAKGGGWIITMPALLIFVWSQIRIIGALVQHTRKSVGIVFSAWMMLPATLVVILVVLMESVYHINFYWTFFWKTIAS